MEMDLLARQKSLRVYSGHTYPLALVISSARTVPIDHASSLASRIDCPTNLILRVWHLVETRERSPSGLLCYPTDCCSSPAHHCKRRRAGPAPHQRYYSQLNDSNRPFCLPCNRHELYRPHLFSNLILLYGDESCRIICKTNRSWWLVQCLLLVFRNPRTHVWIVIKPISTDSLSLRIRLITSLGTETSMLR